MFVVRSTYDCDLKRAKNFSPEYCKQIYEDRLTIMRVNRT